MPRKAKGKGGKKRTTARPAKLRPKRIAASAANGQASAAQQQQPSSPPPKRRATRNSHGPLPSPPPLPRQSRGSNAAPGSPPPLQLGASSSAMVLPDSGGSGMHLDEDEILPNETPTQRTRRQPRRYASRAAREGQVPEQKSMFEGISRDSLQRYMAHFNISKRQDLKRNLVKRVQDHFDQMDVSEIDLEELHRGVVARLRKGGLDSPGKVRKAGR